MSTEDSATSVPQWAVQMQVTIARIDERSRMIDGIDAKVDALRASTVPMTEHQLLMERVEQLWSRDLGARTEWEEIATRVPILWEDRTKAEGERKAEKRTVRAALTVLSTAVALLTAFTFLHDLGVSVGVHP